MLLRVMVSRHGTKGTETKCCASFRPAQNALHIVSRRSDAVKKTPKGLPRNDEEICESFGPRAQGSIVAHMQNTMFTTVLTAHAVPTESLCIIG